MGITARILPSFPRRLVGTGGITVTYLNTTATITYDFEGSGVQAILDAAVGLATDASDDAQGFAIAAENSNQSAETWADIAQTLATAIGEGIVYNTRADAIAAEIPAPQLSVTIARHSSTSPYAEAKYVRGASGYLQFTDALGAPWHLDTSAGEVNILCFAASFLVADMNTAMTNALACVASIAGILRMPRAVYNLSSNFTIGTTGVKIVGDGLSNTNIFFSGTGALFTFYEDTANGISNCGISGMTLFGSGTDAKTGLLLQNVSHFRITDFNITNWTSANNLSIGIHFQGREIIDVDGISIYADLPIYISQNPDRLDFLKIDIDHLHVDNAWLATDIATNPLITVVNGVNYTNVSFANQSWNLGAAGFLAIGGAEDSTSSGLSFYNIRREQCQTAGSFMIHIDRSTSTYEVDGLIAENCYAGIGSAGYKLFGVKKPVILGARHDSAIYNGIAADADCEEVVLIGCRWIEGTVGSMTGLSLRQAGHPGIAPIPQLPSNGVYFATANVAAGMTLKGGAPDGFQAFEWRITKTIADEVEYAIPLFFSKTLSYADIRVLSSSRQNGHIAFSSGGVTKVTGTTNFGVTGNDGDLSIIYNSGTSVGLKNRLGSSMTATVIVDGVYAV